MYPFFEKPKTFSEKMLEMLQKAAVFAPDSNQESPYGPYAMNAQAPSITEPVEITNPVPNVNLRQMPIETENSDAFKQHMESYPERNKPGIGRKIAASLVGLGGGPEAAERALYAPYYRELEDWKTKLPGYQAGMTQERMQNAQGISYDRNQQNYDIQQQKVDISKARAATYEFKAKNPNHVIKENAQGQLVGINPQTNEAYLITDSVGEPVKSATLPDEDKIQLGLQRDLRLENQRQENRMEMEGARQGNRTELEGTRQSNRESNIRLQGTESRATKQTASPTGINKGQSETPTQARIRLINRANQAKIEHPEWSKYITITGTNVVIKPPSDKWYQSGPDTKTHQEIQQYLLGESASVKSDKLSNESQPKIGDIKTFPNGRKGRYDGKGWVAIK